MSKLLEVHNLTKRFGGLVANNSVSLSCDSGEILGIIGPNGAGKTTLLNCINFMLRVDAGQVYLNGRNLTGLPAHSVCQAGIARTFQVVQVVDAMTALENVMVGSFLRLPGTVAARDKAHEALEFVGIQALADEVVSSLTLAQKRKVEFARALATGPRIVLLDELLAGLTAPEIREMTARIRQVADQGIGVVWIEHVMEAIMPLADRMVVLCFGEKIAEGAPSEIATNPRCIEAYLGEESHAAA